MFQKGYSFVMRFTQDAGWPQFYFTEAKRSRSTCNIFHETDRKTDLNIDEPAVDGSEIPRPRPTTWDV